MRMSRPALYRIIVYYMIFYVLDKNLFDMLTMGATKLLYYAVVAVFGIIGIAYCLKEKKYRPVACSFLLYCAFIIFNAIYTYDSERFTVGVIEYLTYPLVFFSFMLLFQSFKTIRQYYKLLYGLFYWSFITSILALYEYIAKVPVIPNNNAVIYNFSDGTSAYRAGVFIGSPMILAIILGIITLIMVYIYKVQNNTTLIKFIIINFVGIFATCSRGPLLFTLVAIAVLYYYFFKKKIIGRETFAKIFILVTLFLILGVIFMIGNIKTGISGIDTIIARFGSTFSTKEDGNSARLIIWMYYLGEFAQSPVIGRGIAITSNLVTNNLSKFIGLFTIGVAESGILTRLVESGIIGYISYIFFIFKSAKLAIKNRQKGNLNSFLRLSNVLVIGILIIYFLEDIILQISTDLFANFMILMMIASIIRINECNNAELKVKVDTNNE